MKGPSEPIRVGLLGYGYSGKVFHAPLIAAVPGLRLCGVSSRAAASVRADYPSAKVYADPLALITAHEIDLIVIATPNDTHAPLARAAIAAGKHVVIDKPFTLDLAEARDLVALSVLRGVLLSVFHNRRWDSDYLTVRRAIDDGLVGTVSQFESHFDRFRPEVRDRWRERAGAGSGVWFDLGPHLVDQAVQILGIPDRVEASLAMQRSGAKTDDWAHVILFHAKQRAILHAGMLVAGGTNRFTVHGDAGSIVKRSSDRQEAQLLEGMLPGAPGWGEDPDALLVYHGEGGGGEGAARQIPSVAGDQRRYYQGIVDAVRGAGPNPVPSVQALCVMAIMEAAVQSSRSRASVDVSLTQEERRAWQ
ncbi:oxidoreductase [Lichenicoccus sp.]|uniref:oxidoreductase n=1 Tax=Lichenicoccus sp. TaxID=2781899 RepID=UPI003D1146FD